MMYYEDMRDDDDEGYDRSSMYFDDDDEGYEGYEGYDDYPMDGYEGDDYSEGLE